MTENPGDEPVSDEELRRQLEERLRLITISDLVVESMASILSLTARRILKEDERDLDQARTGIEAIRGMAASLDEETQARLRPAISELQLLYAQHAGGEGAAAEGVAEADSPLAPPQAKLWTPGT